MRDQLLKLADAQSTALEAAGRWDKMAREISDAQNAHRLTVGEEDEEVFYHVTPEFGIDSSDWHVEFSDLMWSTETPAVAAINKAIREQKTKLQAANLAGDQNR